MDLKNAAQLLGGEVIGAQVLCPGPNHSPGDRSLSVRFDARSPGGFVVTSFAGDHFADCRDHVRQLLGLEREFTASAARDYQPKPGRGLPDVSADRTALAMAIWNEARPDPILFRYAASRGIVFNDEAVGDAIRFHPACPFKGARLPAMIALVRNVITDEPAAIHRTALTLDGHKAEVDGVSRLSLGPVADGAVKATPDAHVTICLGIGEGIESTVSLRLVPEFGASPAWSLLSAGQMANFPVLAAVECLWVAVDHDPAGIKAAQAVADRWRAADREVHLVQSTTAREDLNDIARAG